MEATKVLRAGKIAERPDKDVREEGLRREDIEG